jgi:hypothetical protein
MLDAAYDTGLGSASALVTSAETLRDRFGVSWARLEWELCTQSPWASRWCWRCRTATASPTSVTA